MLRLVRSSFTHKKLSRIIQFCIFHHQYVFGIINRYTAVLYNVYFYVAAVQTIIIFISFVYLSCLASNLLHALMLYHCSAMWW